MGTKFGPYPYAEAFTLAEAFLSKGRSRFERPIASNTTLVRTGEDDIAIVLHSTAVVTYHRDGTMTIFGGGWNTVTTKARIREFSPAHPGSNGKGGWHVGVTGQITPSKIQKCRTCKHRGTWIEPVVCWGPRHTHYGSPDNWCGGAQEVYDVPYAGSGDWDAHWQSRRIQACAHGWHGTRGHHTKPCAHGSWSQHQTGTREASCYRCNGTGMQDYGSKPVEIAGVDASTPYLVDAAGKFLTSDVGRPTTHRMPDPMVVAAQKKAQAEWQAAKATHDAYLASPEGIAETMAKQQAHVQAQADQAKADAAYFASPEYAAKQAAQAEATKYKYGSEVTTRLGAVLPNIYALAKHPVDGNMQKVNSCIISLNDTHHWSREKIADWLDTLDLDLRFPAAV